MADILPTNTTELEAADAQLRALEAEQAAESNAGVVADKTVDTQNSGDRALEGDKKDEKAALETKDDAGTLEADKQELENAKTEAEKEGKELALDDKGTPKRDAEGKFVKQDKVVQKDDKSTKYAKDIARRDNSWKALNTEKETFAKAKESEIAMLKQARAKFDADVQAFQQERTLNTPTPEKYDTFATKCTNDAKIKLAEAITAENEGRIEDAEKLRDEAKFLNRDAEAAKGSAEHLRKNPPANQQQIQAKFIDDQKQWIGKAVQDFPDFGKKDSELQKQAAESFKALTAANPLFSKIPDLIYYCVERASLQAAASKVPALDKELGELRTKVKDLEALTNPSPSGGVSRQASAKSWDSMSADEQYETLRAEASQRR